MEVREKLVELLMQVEDNMCDDCGREPVGCAVVAIADHLIANDVAVQGAADTNVGSKWISVRDRLPEEDVRVLVWVGENSCNFPLIDTDRIHNGRWVRWDKYISHWMPLPAPPKGE